MVLRVVLRLTAAVLIGIAIGVCMQEPRLGFWLMALAVLLGSWGCCPLSRPLLERHRKYADDAGGS
jgi:hypothetical protein